MCFVTSEGFYKIEEGMKTIDKKISQIYDLPLTVTIEDLIKIARNKNIPTKELNGWVSMYYQKDSDDDNKVIEEEVEEGLIEVIFE